MLNRFHQQLTDTLPTHTDLLISLSGGVDSVVLLHLLCQLRLEKQFTLRAVHIHHGLSENADQWADFCQTLCARWHIPLVIKKVKVEGKQGLEANARTARYHAIKEVIQPNEVLVTAHHLDDQAETFFLALKRGAGVKGLAAMQRVSSSQNLTIFRPLLSFSKTELLTYAQIQQLQWINDESNESNQFDRNFLRNEILPQLNQRWSQFSQMVARSSQLCGEQQQLLEELLADELNQRADFSEQSLHIAGFNQYSRLKQQQLIRLWLDKCGQLMPSQMQLAQIIDHLILAERDKNPQVILDGKMLRRYQQKIFITAPLPSSIQAGESFEQKIHLNEEIILPHQLGTIKRTQTDLICNISGRSYPLHLPPLWQSQPLTIKLNISGKVKLYGKSQHEEMKKIWQKNSVPVWERRSTPLLFIRDELATVLYAADNIPQHTIKQHKS